LDVKKELISKAQSMHRIPCGLAKAGAGSWFSLVKTQAVFTRFFTSQALELLTAMKVTGYLKSRCHLVVSVLFGYD
jgi:hypothetical protein